MRRIALSLALSPLVAAPLLTGSTAHAAQVTDVADALDEDDPFDLHVEALFDIQYHHGLLVRENTQRPEGGGGARSIDVREMDFEQFQLRLMPRLEVGVFRDVAVFAQWPIILYQQTSFQYTKGTNNGNSTVFRDMSRAPTIDGWPQTGGNGTTGVSNGGTTYGFPDGGYASWRFDLDDDGKYESVRQGFDNPSLGVRWSPVNNERDDTKPTITLQADYTAPIMPYMDPTADRPSRDQPGPVADGAHKFHFQIAMSKRYSILDPYFLVEYTAPFASSSSYEGYFPRHQGGVELGLEIVPYEDPKLEQKFSIDLGTSGHFLSEGRDYSEVSDVFREITYTDQFFRGGAHAGLFFRAFSYVFLDVTGRAYYDTDHLVTVEKVGTDRGDDTNDNGTCDSNEPKCGKVELDPAEKERNFYFNPVYDTPGRRFKFADSITADLMIHLAVTF